MGRSNDGAATGDSGFGPTTSTEQLRRIANLLALLATKGEGQTDKVLTLTAAGFSTSEVAALLRMTPNNVAVLVYKSKHKGKATVPARKKRGKND